MSVILSLNKAPAPQPTGPNLDYLLEITEQLTQLIEQEISALTSDHTRDISCFEKEKARLSLAYSKEMNLVRNHPDQVANWPDDMIEELKRRTQNFQKALKVHVATLDRAKGVTETVLQSIGKHVAERTRPVIGYGKDANQRLANARAPVSLAYDQAI
jgi:formate dehydrogenase assembly factor FdhD